MLFIIHFEEALIELRKTELDKIQPNERIYADDVDFISMEILYKEILTKFKK